ncbi:MAG: VanZ family protein [Bacteroidia bacterium]|nr:VanZ family protein [Bacteroidia bacterium]
MLQFTLRLWQIIFGIYVLIITVLATWPISLPEIPGGDKTNHIMAFAVMIVLIKQAWPKGHWMLHLLCCFLYGILIEVMQSFLPFRVASIGDIIADIVGILIGKSAVIAYSAFAKPKKY